MEVWGGNYEKPEINIVAERLHSLRSKKADLELELSEQKFRFRYIPQRKEIAQRQSLNLMFLIVPLTFFMLLFVIVFCAMMLEEERKTLYSATGGVVVLLGGFLLAFGGYADYILLKQAIPLLKLLSRKGNADNVKEETIQSDVLKTKERIDFLEKEIAKCEKDISDNQERLNQILEEKEYRENVLREKGILFDENPNQDAKGSGLSLRKSGEVDAEAAAQLYEYYKNEELYITNCMLQLEGKLEHINRELVDIDEKFEQIKKRLLYSGIAFLFVIIIQSQFTGILQNLTSLLCLFFSASYILYLERVCKKPLLDYLVEHDSIFTKEYAFCNNAIPVYQRRRDVMEQIDCYKKELSDLKREREMIKFS